MQKYIFMLQKNYTKNFPCKKSCLILYRISKAIQVEILQSDFITSVNCTGCPTTSMYIELLRTLFVKSSKLTPWYTPMPLS